MHCAHEVLTFVSCAVAHILNVRNYIAIPAINYISLVLLVDEFFSHPFLEASSSMKKSK